MKKIFFVLVAVALLAGCASRDAVMISSPPQAGNFSVLPISPDPKVWRPDSTRAIFRNASQTIHIEVWLDGKFSGAPALKLLPEQAAPANFSGLGDNLIYLRGRERTQQGWRDLGYVKFQVPVYRNSFGSVREIVLGDWSFVPF